MALAIGIIIGVALGALAVFAVLTKRTGAQQAALATERASASAAKDEVERLRGETESLRTNVSKAEAEAASQRARVEALEVARLEDRSTFDEQIKTATNEVIAQGSARLTELAAERFKGEVDPLKVVLERYEVQLRDLETKRERAYSSVDDHLKRLTASEESLRRETAALVTALRSPQTRGLWGEQQLRRVVEYAGMLEHCDFNEQVSSTTEDGRQRPDLVVHMPDGANLIVDSKVPLDAYLRIVEADDDATRKAEAKEHARQLRSHIDALAKKDYSALHGTESTGFVVCFVPGEALVTTAFEADPELFDHAMKKNVLISGPVNLIALLKTVNVGWRHESLAKEAAAIHDAGLTLHRYLKTFAEHLGKVGKGINAAAENYNKAIGSMESRLLPASRAFENLKLVDQAVEAPERVDHHAVEISRPELLGAEQPEGLHLLEPPVPNADEA